MIYLWNHIEKLSLPKCPNQEQAVDRGLRAAYGRTLVGVECEESDAWFALYVQPGRHYYMPRNYA